MNFDEQYDYRAKAGVGKWVDILDPFTKEPIKSGDETAQMKVVGLTSEHASERIEALQESGKLNEMNTTSQVRDANNATAAAVITGFRNVQFDNKDADASDDKTIMRFLNCTQPVFKGKQMVNYPFAHQASDAATEIDQHLGNE